jgi:2-polyprenyl-3-methyl-5-hydroxy-6-metoxy-1,4-benzoquinol methylase
MAWAEPDVDHAIEGMLWVYNNRKEANEKAGNAAGDLRRHYSAEAIGKTARIRLEELRSRLTRSFPVQSHLEKNAPIVKRPTSVGSKPPAPIPPEWYDEDYFEHGRKSNWTGGYNWIMCRQVFTQTADLLEAAFPEAKTYVDAGCARGYLVRTLCERGLDASGFDHAPWAIAHADHSVSSRLRMESVDLARYEAFSIDVLSAMSLFESLTEPQLMSFLQRAASWVRLALFVTIPLADARNDRDLSHITMRSSAWWWRRFRESGWQMHCSQRILRQSPLIAKMRWNAFALTPVSSMVGHLNASPG